MSETLLSDTLSPGTLHDLRTPLNQIIGYSELLQEQVAESGVPDLADDLRKINLAGQRMLALLSVVATSPTDGDGARPASEPAPAPAPAPQPERPVVRPPEREEDGPASILVVDDNEMNRDVLARRLERQGYVTKIARDGAEAMESVRANPFDLVLLDVMMPVMDGYETLRQLKADDGLRNIPVIMISALDEVDSVVRCIEMGAEDYLPKPFNATLLKARIGASLEKKRARDREHRLYVQLQENFEQLKDLTQQRDDLTHMIVHDLRTPLTSLTMGLQTVEMVGELNDEQKEIFGIALGGGAKLLEMVNSLLDVTKMESGSMTLDRTTIHAAELVAEAVGQIAQLAEMQGLGLIQQIEPDVVPFSGDVNLLRRTLVNLVGNAIKFTPAGGSVTVAVRRGESPDAVVFSVIDTGEGMPPEAAGYIFEKFGQVESRQRGRGSSTGLGLTFCRLVVEAHGGEIGVQSVLGEGSTFSFWIPLEASS